MTNTEGITPNDNLPGDVPPGTVGSDAYSSGDPNGLEIIEDPGGPGGPFPRSVITASPWSGWPGEWNTPILGQGRGVENLVDTAWTCLDKNSAILSTMPAYTIKGDQVVAGRTWLTNPDPDLYTSWHEFLRQLFWDFQMGEAFIIATAYYEDGWPQRFHVLEPWTVNVEMDSGRRRYNVGSLDVTNDILHIRYKSGTSSARGIGPLEAGRTRMISAMLLARYAEQLVSGGGIPYYVIKHPKSLTARQSDQLLAQWYESRTNRIGMPAVLSGGVELDRLQWNPQELALVDLSKHAESRIAVMLGMPPFLVGLPSGGDSLTYSTVAQLFDYHWRAELRTRAVPVMAALSGWLLPRGTALELNRDEYVRPAFGERMTAYAQARAMADDGTGPVITNAEIRQMERFNGVGAPAALTGARPDMPTEPEGAFP
jgi:HK97 family phage portal protein